MITCDNNKGTATYIKISGSERYIKDDDRCSDGYSKDSAGSERYSKDSGGRSERYIKYSGGLCSIWLSPFVGAFLDIGLLVSDCVVYFDFD